MQHQFKKVNILFWLYRSRGNKSGAPLRCRVSINKQRYEISLNYHVPYEIWIGSAQRCKSNSNLGKEINAAIRNLQDEIEGAVEELRRERIELTIENLRFQLSPEARQEREEHHSVLSLFDYHQVIERNNISPATMKLYKVTRNHAAKFIQIKYRVKDIDIRRIKKDFAAEFFAYLQGWKRSKDEIVCQNNAAVKHIQRITRVFNIAYDNEWIEKNPLLHFRTSTKAKDREFLDALEILRIQQLKDLTISERRTRDMFIFAIFTAISYTDITTLTTSNITIGMDGKEWITYKRKKTGVRVMVPLLDPAKEVIEKYGKVSNYLATNPLLPISTNQQCNRDLKKIAEKAKINKKVTFHISRHTFATTITLSNNIPIETVSSMLGHTNISTTQIYAKIVGQKITKDSQTLRNIFDHQTDNLSKVINQ